MSGRGNWLDNAATEIWFSTVNFYNQRRRHSTLDYVSAARCERDRITELQMGA